MSYWVLFLQRKTVLKVFHISGDREYKTGRLVSEVCLSSSWFPSCNIVWEIWTICRSSSRDDFCVFPRDEQPVVNRRSWKFPFRDRSSEYNLMENTKYHTILVSFTRSFFLGLRKNFKEHLKQVFRAADPGIGRSFEKRSFKVHFSLRISFLQKCRWG